MNILNGICVYGIVQGKQFPLQTFEVLCSTLRDITIFIKLVKPVIFTLFFNNYFVYRLKLLSQVKREN